MKVVYAEKEDMGIRYAAALGGIRLNGKIVTTDNLTEHMESVKKAYSRSGQIETTYNGEDYIVTWGWGHFGTLKDIKDYNPDYKKWYDIPLPFIPEHFEVKRRSHKEEYFRSRDDRQFKIIKELFNRSDCEYIINATDWEREGELIFIYVYELTGTKKPYYRLRNTAKTTAEIRKAFANLVDSTENHPFVQAAKGRSIADWIIGINMTIAATIYLSPKSELINIGRVLTPTLALIVNREKEIRNFKPETVYGIQGEFTTNHGETYSGKCEDTFKSKDMVLKIMKTLPDSGTIRSIERKKVTKHPPLLHNTQTLQIEANEVYGYTLEQTLNIAQKLYESGYTTYPRVDSQYLTEDKEKEIPGLIQSLTSMNRYKNANISMNNMPKRYFNDKKVDGHDAIIITDSIPKQLTTEQANVYDLIARRMLMAVSDPQISEKTTIITEVNDGASSYVFKTTGTVVQQEGFTKLKPKKAKDKKDPELPKNISKGEVVDSKYSDYEQTSTPPSRFTDATLIKAMENCGKKEENETAKKYLQKSKGIGRPATRAGIMERLISRNFVSRQGKSIVPTEFGEYVIDIVSIDDIKSPILTAKWEEALDEIESSKPNESDLLLNNFLSDVEETSKTWCTEMKGKKVQKETRGKSWDTGIKCPICGKNIYISKKEDYYCSGIKDKSCSFFIKGSYAGKKITTGMLEQLAENGETGVLKLKSKNNKPYKAKFKLVPLYRCKECGARQRYDETGCYKCDGELVEVPGEKTLSMEFVDYKKKKRNN